MRKKVVSKGNLRRSDHMRALVTDTLPGDVPIIISNDGFYKNMSASGNLNNIQRDFLRKLLSEERRYTIPYRYDITRPNRSPRRLSLLHPFGQLRIVDLYKDFGDLICFYCRKSEASIRSPLKIGSTYFIRDNYSGKNNLKGSSIDTVEIENSVSNPASYFSYKGFDRAFKFFDSPEYLRLEKRYAVMCFADVSKCFDTIYTHTLFWAINDIDTAKQNISADAFGNRSDRLMQSLNYNETNGICVGAEVGRIFAELILSEVDKKAILLLSGKGLTFRVHYEFRRYVDDFYIFCANRTVVQEVLGAIRHSLSIFKLSLNDQKTQEIVRPFITTKTRMVRDANETLNSFFSKFLVLKTTTSNGINLSYVLPTQIWRSHALLRSLLEGIKASCFDNQSGYEATSSYVIGALSTRLFSLIDGYALAIDNKGYEEENYISSVMILLEAIYFFYNVHPTVASSLRLAQAAVRAHSFFHDNLPTRTSYLIEQVVKWTFQFIKELDGVTRTDCVPLESINALLVIGEVGKGEAFSRQAIRNFCTDLHHARYFEIVSYLFCFKDDPEMQSLRNSIFDHAVVLTRGKGKILVDSEAAHLALDILACPFIDPVKRAKLFQSLCGDIDLATPSEADALQAVQDFEKTPWFVDWHNTNLMALIRKKELSAVY